MKHYDVLMERAKNRTVSGYTERHHIIPRCMGGSNEPSNIIRLTAEEHYVAHQLLVRMYPGNRKLVFAICRMTGKTPGRNNKLYGWLRRAASNAQRGRVVSEETKMRMRGKTFSAEHRRKIGVASTGKQWSLGLKRSDETKLKLSLANRGKTTALKGRPKSEEHKQNMRRPKSEEHKQKLREANLKPEVRAKLSARLKGRVVSEEQKQKQSEAMRGRPSSRRGAIMSEDSRRKLSESQKLRFGNSLPLGINRHGGKYRVRYRGKHLGRCDTLEAAIQMYNNHCGAEK